MAHSEWPETPPDAAKRPRKAAGLTIRMTSETRDSLGRAAAREGRSVSEIAERWLDAGSRGEESYQARIGGSQVSEAIEALLDFAGKVEREIGNPRTFLPARDALMSGWALLIDKALPYTPDTPEGETFRMRRASFAMNCGEVMRLVGSDHAPEDLKTALLAPGPRTRNAFFPDAEAEASVSLFDLLSDVVFVRVDPLTVASVKIRAQALVAGASPEFAEWLGILIEAATDFEVSYAAYMQPRADASARGRELAGTMGSVAPLGRLSPG